MANRLFRILRGDWAPRRRVVAAVALPDFRNLGVMLRIVVLAEGLRFLAVYAHTGSLTGAVQEILGQSSFFEPVLLTALMLLFLASVWLAAQPYRYGVALVLGLAVESAVVWWMVFAAVFPDSGLPGLLFTALMTTALTLTILGYFNWRHRVFSPALVEARLMGLQSRIRPHFLFNSLNTVLALMRDDPAKAERVLENLAELFRSLLAESGTLVELAREVELARIYAEIETMRLGPRLAVDWQCEEAALDALVPPLFLQPLLENGVYHGIEPSEAGGTISVSIFRKGDHVHVVTRNPFHPQRIERRSGNRMALNNIRERLALHFDLEAEMKTFAADGEFVVQVQLPYKHA